MVYSRIKKKDFRCKGGGEPLFCFLFLGIFFSSLHPLPLPPPHHLSISFPLLLLSYITPLSPSSSTPTPPLYLLPPPPSSTTNPYTKNPKPPLQFNWGCLYLIDSENVDEFVYTRRAHKANFVLKM
ncbi:hypothetical protein VIGAN_01071100 [Vigna angularis var. angularis]|uniref:Uncharacterized protein n=1 Tax=Vigna angularis var. angularis TaxID=157739 RepID=A0A0S3QY49_PHAAN|nr:hypothetical protein VIGAN_01071100 [Vigna angularis var. angularis]